MTSTSPHGATAPAGRPAAARARGEAIRRARASRVRTIRRRVLAGAVALFVATWLLIGAVLVSGHDPALAARNASTTAASSGNVTTGSNTGTASGDATSTGTSSDGSNAATSSGASSGSNAAPSSVTTRQS